MTNKFEIIKGSEKDFEGAPDWALYLDVYATVKFWSEGHEVGDRYTPKKGMNDFHYTGKEAESTIIAERRIIPEPQPDAEGWIEWKGGKRPVSFNARVDVKYRDGQVNCNESAGYQWAWGHSGSTADIIAYRLPKPEEPSTPVWNGEGLPPVGSKVMTPSGVGVIDYVGSEIIAYTNQSGQWSVRCDCFRERITPIRSPEKVEQDKAFDELEEIEKLMPDGYQPYELIDAIVQAGYRKEKK